MAGQNRLWTDDTTKFAGLGRPAPRLEVAKYPLAEQTLPWRDHGAGLCAIGTGVSSSGAHDLLSPQPIPISDRAEGMIYVLPVLAGGRLIALS